MGMARKAEGQLFNVERLSTKLTYDSSGRLTEVMPDMLAHDYDPTTGEYVGVLVEPEATNLIMQSNSFNSAAGWNVRSVYDRKSDEINPILGDYTSEIRSVAGISDMQRLMYLIEMNGELANFTVYLKEGECRYVTIREDKRDDPLAAFDLRDGSVRPMGPDSRFTAAYSEPVGDGWYRYVLVGYYGYWNNSDKMSSVEIRTGKIVDGELSTVEGIYSDDEDLVLFHAWGAQLTFGSNVHSHIPTQGSVSTQPADRITFDNTGPHYNPSAGTWVAEFKSKGGSPLGGIGADGAKLEGSGVFVYTYDKSGGTGFASGAEAFTTPPLGSRPLEVSLGDQQASIHITNVQYHPYRMPDTEAKSRATGTVTVDYPFHEGRSLMLNFEGQDYAWRSLSDAVKTARSATAPLTVSRSTPATYATDKGELEVAAPDEIRHASDFKTGDYLGIQLEPESTNLVTLVPTGGYTATWVGETAPDGSEGVWLATGMLDAEGERAATKTNVIEGELTYTASGYFKAKSAADVGKQVDLAISRSTVLDVPSRGTGVAFSLTDEWQRQETTVTLLPEHIDTKLTFSNRPGDSADEFYFWGLQVEPGSKATSYIATDLMSDRVPVTRQADVVELTAPSDYLARGEGTWVLDVAGEGASALEGAGVNGVRVSGTGKLVYCYDSQGGAVFAAGEQVFTTPGITRAPNKLTLGDQRKTIYLRGVDYYDYKFSTAEAEAAATGSLEVDYLMAGGQSLDLDFLGQDYGSRSSVDALEATRSDTLTDVASFTRPSVATYWDHEGRLQIAGIDEPRIDHDPETGEVLGILIERAATNNDYYSETTSGKWFTVMGDLTVSESKTAGIPSTRLTYQGSTEWSAIRKEVATEGDFSQQGIFKISDPDKYVLAIRRANYGDSPSFHSTFDFETGEFVYVGTSSSATPSAKRLFDGSYLLKFPNLRDDVSGWIMVLIPKTDDPKYMFDSSAPEAGAWFECTALQTEDGARCSSYVPNSGANGVTRGEDTLNLATDNWYDKGKGTFFIEYAYLDNVFDNANNAMILNSSADRRLIYNPTSPKSWDSRVSVGAGTSVPTGKITKAAMSYSTDSGLLKIASEGTAKATSNYSGRFSDITSVFVMSLIHIEDRPSGYVRHLQYIPKLSSLAELEAMTTLTTTE